MEKSTVDKLMDSMSDEERQEFEEEFKELLASEKKLASAKGDLEYIKLNEELASKMENKFKARKKSNELH